MEEVDVTGDDLGADGDDPQSEIVFHKVPVSTARTSPRELHGSPPAAKQLTSGFLIIEIIEHRSIMVSGILVNGCEDLLWVSELECRPDINSLVNILGPLYPTVVSH